MSEIGVWWEQGERRALSLGSCSREVWVRRLGSGPVLTLLHGFPSSAHDWAPLVGGLAAQHTLLLADLLGFGDSDKPPEHDYSLLEQADLVEELWRQEGVRESAILAHDYSVSLTQELLARRAEGVLDVAITRAHLLNGGLYPDLHRPEPAQLALLDPVQGPRVAELLDEPLLAAGLAPTFGPGYDPAADAAAMWEAMSRRDGLRVAHRLIAYIPERERLGERWVGALEGTDVPLAFTWGMLDPVSGAHMAQRIRERLPAAPFTVLDDVGHWPQLEAPERVLAAVLAD